MNRQDRRADPHRQIAAAHELGHALVFEHYGIAYGEIVVNGSGESTEGHVTGCKQVLVGKQCTGEVAGILAGAVAGMAWADEQGWPELGGAEQGSTDDATARALCAEHGYSYGDALAEARALVNRYWLEIERLAPDLAERGTITL